MEYLAWYFIVFGYLDQVFLLVWKSVLLALLSENAGI